jgi:hypothetical protein
MSSSQTPPPNLFNAHMIRFKRRYICGSLLFLQSSIAFAIGYFSTGKFLTWWNTTHSLHHENDLTITLSVYIISCAPLCSVIGVLAAGLYYTRKRGKYGKFDFKMRRKGRRGYAFDPKDEEDKAKAKEAERLNREPRVKPVAILSIATTPPVTEPHESLVASLPPAVPKRISFFNPYGWGQGANTDTVGLEKRGAPQPGVARSNSIKTCKDDPVTKKAVANIWLDGVTDRFRGGYDGRATRKSTWNEEMELEGMESKN